MVDFTLGETQAPAPTAPKPQAKKQYPSIPAGQTVDCEVVSVEVRDKPEWAIRDDGETKEVSFRFRVINGAYERRNLWGNAAPYFNNDPDCILRLWVQGILGAEVLPDGFTLELESLAGKHCRVTVGNRTVKATGEIKDFVQDVLPASAVQDANAFF